MSKAIVIGGGYFGCAIAYKLAKSGVKTILLEQKEIGAGASGANFGCVQVQDSEPGLSLELTLKGYKGIKGMEKELGRDLDFREIGAIVIAQNTSEMEEITKLADLKRKQGLKVEVLDQQLLQKFEPNLNVQGLAGATYSLQGHLNGFKYMYGLVTKGKEYGLEVREQTKVKSLIMESGICVGVELASGEKLYAEHVIVTAGAWSKALCEPLGLSVPVEYVKAEALVTEQLEPFVQNYFSLASFFTEAHGLDEAITSLCCTQTKAGNLLLGETSKPSNISPNDVRDLTSREHCLGIRKTVQRFFPALKDVNVLRSWVTCSPYTSSLLPVFGQSEIPGLILAAGFKSAIVLSSIVGDIVTDLVHRGQCDYDLTEFLSQIQSQRSA
jgi:sarcosine oxidase subunit beta